RRSEAATRLDRIWDTRPASLGHLFRKPDTIFLACRAGPRWRKVCARVSRHAPAAVRADIRPSLALRGGDGAGMRSPNIAWPRAIQRRAIWCRSVVGAPARSRRAHAALARAADLFRAGALVATHGVNLAVPKRRAAHPFRRPDALPAEPAA